MSKCWWRSSWDANTVAMVQRAGDSHQAALVCHIINHRTSSSCGRMTQNQTANKHASMSEHELDSRCCTCLSLLALPASEQPQEGSVAWATAQSRSSPGREEAVSGIPLCLHYQYWVGEVKEANIRRQLCDMLFCIFKDTLQDLKKCFRYLKTGLFWETVRKH